MIQQMFGRAGRIGAGEREGWAFLLADPAERAHWQARLAAGYTVRSRLNDHLPDHLLASDWSGTTRPNDCAPAPDRYRELLAERATGVRLDLREDRARVVAPPGSVIRLWNGATTTLHSGGGEEATLLLPPDGASDDSVGNRGAAVFTRGGDQLGTGWLGVYSAIRR